VLVSDGEGQKQSVDNVDRWIDVLTSGVDEVLFRSGAPGSNSGECTDRTLDYWISQFQLRGFQPLDEPGSYEDRRYRFRRGIPEEPRLEWRLQFRGEAGEIGAPAMDRVRPDTAGEVRKIAIGIVSFNPTEEQRTRIQGTSKIMPTFVADNSEPQVSPLDGPQWASMGRNAGIAAALNKCAEMATASGYEWILLLDQDTEVDRGEIDRYLEAFRAFDDKDGTAIVAPVTDKREAKRTGEGNTRELLIVMTSGCLMNLRIWKEIGGYAEELFIDEVDHEFCLRAKSKGYRVVRLLHAYMKHQPGKLMTLMTRHGPTLVGWHPPRRLYYIVRNYFYIKRYADQFPEFIANRKMLVIAKFKEYLRYHHNRHKSVYQMLRGAIHGKLGRFGR
jgi:rhamnosyltransferase